MVILVSKMTPRFLTVLECKMKSFPTCTGQKSMSGRCMGLTRASVVCIINMRRSGISQALTSGISGPTDETTCSVVAMLLCCIYVGQA